MTPSPKPFSPGGAPLKTLPECDWTPEMKTRCAWVHALAQLLLGHDITILLTPDTSWGSPGATARHAAWYVNYGALGKKWFTTDKCADSVLGFLCHEFTHDKVLDHLSNEFHEEQARLLCMAARDIRRDPEFWR